MNMGPHGLLRHPLCISLLTLHAVLWTTDHPTENRLQMGKYWATTIYLKSVFKILQPVTEWKILPPRFCNHRSSRLLLLPMCPSREIEVSLGTKLHRQYMLEWGRERGRSFKGDEMFACFGEELVNLADNGQWPKQAPATLTRTLLGDTGL